MGRRSPGNPRYQKHTAPAGKTRRSASSAKMKRSAPEKPKRTRFGLPAPTPEMKRWRRIWWVLLLVALGFAGSMLIPGVRENRAYQYVALTIEFAALGVAVWIDWKKIRPMRQEQLEQAKQERERAGKR